MDSVLFSCVNGGIQKSPTKNNLEGLGKKKMESLAI